MSVPNATLRQTLLSVIFVGLALCYVLTAYLILHTPASPKVARATPAGNLPKTIRGTRTTVNAALPMRLKIPSINVDAGLEYVELTPKGDLDAPKDPASAAWYSQGPRPGDSGNAIIDGHFGYKNNRAAVFDDLHVLKEGDKIYIEDERKATVAFVVRELREYHPDGDTTEVFRAKDGKAHLNLITCKGSWNKAQKSYTARLVVFADRATE